PTRPLNETGPGQTPGRFVEIELRWLELNQRPPGYEPGEIPLLHTARMLYLGGRRRQAVSPWPLLLRVLLQPVCRGPVLAGALRLAELLERVRQQGVDVVAERADRQGVLQRCQRLPR